MKCQERRGRWKKRDRRGRGRRKENGLATKSLLSFPVKSTLHSNHRSPLGTSAESMQLHVGKASGKLVLAFPQTLPDRTRPLAVVPLYSLAIINLRHGCMLSPVSLPVQLST